MLASIVSVSVINFVFVCICALSENKKKVLKKRDQTLSLVTKVESEDLLPHIQTSSVTCCLFMFNKMSFFTHSKACLVPRRCSLVERDALGAMGLMKRFARRLGIDASEPSSLAPPVLPPFRPFPKSAWGRGCSKAVSVL